MIRKVRGEEIPVCVDIIHFCYKEMENVNLIILQYCQSIDIRALEDNYQLCRIINIAIVEENRVLRKWYELNGAIHIGTKKYDFFPFTCGYMKKELQRNLVLGDEKERSDG